MKLKGSHRFIAIALAIVLACWSGWKGYAWVRLSGVELTAIDPGRVDFVAVSPKAGYKIIVANQVAYLAKVEGGELGVGDMDMSGEDVAGASRLPLREMIGTLQGRESDVGVFVMRLNDWEDPDLRARVWKAEDIQKAIAGDPSLKQALEKDLNVHLDGTPLDTISLERIQEGIVIDSPVTLEFARDGKTRSLKGRVQESYQPMFCSKIETRLQDKFNVPASVLTGIYLEETKAQMDAGQAENVSNSLSNRIEPRRLARLTEAPRRVLENTTVLLNESHITSASYRNYDVGKGQTANDVTIGLTEEGRMRLWKYSHDNHGFQLLLLVDTIAIAAPRITTELAESHVTISRVPSEDLVKNAIEVLNEILRTNHES